MAFYVIVGGGISGLLTARALQKKDIPFVLLEKSESIETPLEMGHYRFYASSAKDFLSEIVDGIEWNEVSDPPRMRKKGDWSDLGNENVDAESFYLNQPFFHPTQDFSSVMRTLAAPISDHIQFRKEVVEIRPETKTILCQDGSSVEYEKIIWCGPLAQLNHVWTGDKLRLMRLLKKIPPDAGGINLTLETDRSLLPSRNSILFPFRFKEKKMRALGMERENPQAAAHRFTLEWLLLLDEETAEDREEVAKCLRTMRRELEKEFPELKPAVKQERIVFLNHLLDEAPAEGDSLEVLPQVFYIGPQLAMAGEDMNLRHLDLAVANCRRWEETLSL